MVGAIGVDRSDQWSNDLGGCIGSYINISITSMHHINQHISQLLQCEEHGQLSGGVCIDCRYNKMSFGSSGFIVTA